jgi:hypothetical protein
MWSDQVLESVRRWPKSTLRLAGAGLDDYEIHDDASRVAAVRAIKQALKYRPPTEQQRAIDLLAEAGGAGAPPDLMMNERHVARLAAAGMDVGCHTASHPILATVPDAVARGEIADSAQQIADIIGRRPRSFAYPNGQPGKDFLPVHAHMVREAGFTHALTTVRGLARPAHDRFQLPRISPLWKPTRASLAANLARIYVHG